MLTDDQVIEQCSLIKKMLEVSSYFNGVTVECTTNDYDSSVFDFGGDYFIEVRYSNEGIPDYLPGYYKQYGGFGSEPPHMEEVYFGNGNSRKCRSLHRACVRLVSRLYEDELHIALED